MPQPCDPKQRTWPRKLTLARQACALELSAAVVEWAHVERVMTRLLQGAMGGGVLDRVPGTANLGSWVATGVMSNLDSTHQRLLIIQAVLTPLLPPDLVQRWEGLEKEIRACARQRNLLAHSAWALTDEFPDDLVREDQSGKITRHTARDFADVGERIWNLRQALEQFFLELFEAARQGRCGFK